MNRIQMKFRDLKKAKRKALIAYVTGGHPTFAAMNRAAADLERAGVDILEIGVPFSDPIADGPAIQAASQAALARGVSLASLLNWAKKFRRVSPLPVVFMSYLNPLYRMGYEAFARRAAAAGVDGCIVPDLPLEEAGGLRKILARRGVDLIYLVSPTTPPARQQVIAQKTRGFLYAVSIVGVTGERKSLPPETLRFLDGLKKRSAVPVAVGFGIASAETARRLAPHADGVIVGSAIVSRVGQRKPLYPFVKSLRTALDRTAKES